MSDIEETLPTEGDIVAGKYLVDKVLGRGGMGLVVGATHTLLDQKVAIKFLTAEAQGELLERFAREARAVAKLKSEYVARVYDVGELDDGTPFMVMEYLAGEDLGDVSKRLGALPVETAVLYILQACHAVAEAHGAGIIHRDLKPSNLFLTTSPDGGECVKVLDFGISKDTSVESSAMDEEDGELTKTSMVLGTPYYMSPEQMRSARSVDARSDVWSMGAILYQLLCNDKPFRAASFPELVVKVLQEEPPAPSTRRSDLPPGLQRVVLRCLQKLPEQRYSNIGELAIELAPYGPPEADAMAERIARLVVRTTQVALPAVSRRHVPRGVSATGLAAIAPIEIIEQPGTQTSVPVTNPGFIPTLPSAGASSAVSPSQQTPGPIYQQPLGEPSTLAAASVENPPQDTGAMKRPLMLLAAAVVVAVAIGVGLGVSGHSGESGSALAAATGEPSAEASATPSAEEGADPSSSADADDSALAAGSSAPADTAAGTTTNPALVGAAGGTRPSANAATSAASSAATVTPQIRPPGVQPTAVRPPPIQPPPVQPPSVPTTPSPKPNPLDMQLK